MSDHIEPNLDWENLHWPEEEEREFNRQVEALENELMAVTDRELLHKRIRELVARALAGDVVAAKVILANTVGVAQAADREQMRRAAESPYGTDPAMPASNGEPSKRPSVEQLEPFAN